MTAPPKKWLWRQRTAEDVRRRLQHGQFRDHIIAAYDRNTKALCDYLQSDLPLCQEDRKQLADLIHWRIQRKLHDTRGPAHLLNPVTAAEHYIAHLVRVRQKERYGNGPAPWGSLDELIDEVWGQLAEGGHFYGVDGISENNIRALLKRGRKTRSR